MSLFEPQNAFLSPQEVKDYSMWQEVQDLPSPPHVETLGCISMALSIYVMRREASAALELFGERYREEMKQGKDVTGFPEFITALIDHKISTLNQDVLTRSTSLMENLSDDLTAAFWLNAYRQAHR